MQNVSGRNSTSQRHGSAQVRNLVLYLATCLVIGRPTSAAVNINTDAVQKTVVFLYPANANGTAAETPIGTGFLVEIPLTSDAKRAYRVLVTARHMVDPAWAKCSQPNPTLIYARLNKRSYRPGSSELGVGYVPVPLIDGSGPLWHHHKDNDIDAAVVSIKIDDGLFDMSAVPVWMFPTEEEIASESIGDPIISAGLMPGLAGHSRNYPIFKFGQISNIFSEDIETHCTPASPGFLVKVWLVAANLIPGNSGSPIFYVPPGANGVSLGSSRPMLLGVQSTSFAGADVAGMTPAEYVYQILQDMAFHDGDLRRGPATQIAPRPSE